MYIFYGSRSRMYLFVDTKHPAFSVPGCDPCFYRRSFLYRRLLRSIHRVERCVLYTVGALAL